ncbi:MAG: hypothetical protein ACE5HT_08800 [Gemmatimonadales bacterium]
MVRARTLSPLLMIGFLSWGCGGSDSEADRDLTLPPAESVATLHDQPTATDTPPAGTQAESPAESQPTPARPRSSPSRRTARKPAPKPAPPTLSAGTQIDLVAADTLTSKSNKVGDRVTATTVGAVKDGRGRVVLPAGAVLTGTITGISSDGVSLEFNQVHFGGKLYGVTARSDSVAFQEKGQGVTGGDAAKVGAGAVVGAIAGRVIGKNTKGAVIGGIAGAAAGAGVAAATKGHDLVVPAGALVRIVLTAPLVIAGGA